MSQTTESNYRLVEKFYQCLTAEDFETAMDLLSPDIEIHEPSSLPFSGIYQGLDGLGRLLEEATKYVSLSSTKVEEILAGDTVVVAVIKVLAVQTGKEVSVIEESTIVDGKIAKVRVFHFEPAALT